MGVCSENQCKFGSMYLIDSADRPKPELSVQVIRMPVDVYSGIAPPQALLDQMADRPAAQPAPNPNLRPPGPANGLSPGLSPGGSRPPAQGQSDHVEPSPMDIPADAPPSYEDAMADELGPVDGSRRDYDQSAPPRASGKGSGNDDRLFPESGR